MGCGSSGEKQVRERELEEMRQENKKLKILIAENKETLKREDAQVASLKEDVEVLKRSLTSSNEGQETKDPTAAHGSNKTDDLRAIEGNSDDSIPTFDGVDTVEEVIFALNTANAQGPQEGSSPRSSSARKLIANALAAVVRLASNNMTNQRRFGELGACDHVTSLMQLHAESSIDVAENGLVAVRVLCRCSVDKATSNASNLLDFFDNQGCETVIASMRSHIKSAKIVDLAAYTIAVMAFDPRLNDKLGKAGVCEALLDALKEHAQNPQIVEQIMKTAFNLTAFDDNRHRLTDLGLCEIAIYTLEHYQTMAPIALRSLAVISSLASEDTQNMRFNNDQSCAAVVSALKQFGKNEDIVEYACLAIASLCSSHVEIAERFGSHQACELVTSVLFKNKNKAGVVEQACMAIMNLSIHDANNKRMGKVGACEYVLFGFNPAFGSDTKVAEQAVMAIINLAVDVENRERLADCGACNDVVNLMKIVSVDPGAVKECCMAINNLAANNPLNKTLLGDAGACPAVAKVLEDHMREANVVYQALGAVTNLASMPENRAIFAEFTHVCQSVVTAMGMHLNARNIVEKGCSSIANLALDDEGNRRALISFGALELLQRVHQNASNTPNSTVALSNAQAALDTLSFRQPSPRLGMQPRVGPPSPPNPPSPRLAMQHPSGRNMPKSPLRNPREFNTPPKARSYDSYRQQSVHHYASMKYSE
jgi:hypothetical protein